MCRVAEIIMAGFLVLIGYKDWKTKQISGVLLLGMTIAVVLLRMFVMRDSWWVTGAGIIVGSLFFIISRCSREAVGYGDSWLILILGILVGGKILVEILFAAMFLTSLFSLFYCMKKGWNKKHTLPFAPFLTVAYMGVIFL